VFRWSEDEPKYHYFKTYYHCSDTPLQAAAKLGDAEIIRLLGGGGGGGGGAGGHEDGAARPACEFGSVRGAWAAD
jgi:hypothetical protein